MKKLCILFLIAAIAICSVGCAVTPTSGGNEDYYEVVWYDKGPTSVDAQLVSDAMSEYTKEKIGVTVKYVPIVGSEYDQKLQLDLASGEKIDMCFVNSTHFLSNVLSGAFIELDELLANEGKDAMALLDDTVIKAAQVNGKTYAYPIHKDMAAEEVLYYRKDLAEKYNLDMDSYKTFKDLEPALAKIKQEEPSIYPLTFLPSFNPMKFLPFDVVSGLEVGAVRTDVDDGKIINQFATAEALDYMKTAHDFYNKGYLRPDIATITTNSDIQSTVFMNIFEELPYLVDQWNKSVTYPCAVWKPENSKPLLSTKGVQGAMTAITTASKNPNKTMEFINLLNTDKELRNIAAYGIEGKHWIAVGEDFYKLPDGFKTAAETGYRSYVFTQGNKYLTRMIEGTPADIYDKYLEHDAKAIVSPSLGFIFNPDPVTSEITAVNNVYKEYMPSLLSGSVDPEVYLPIALNKMEKAGLSTVLKEVQKQYDAWRKIK